MSRTNTAATIPADSKLANTAGRKERIAVLSAINTAEDLLGSSLLAALRMTAEHGQTSTDEVKEGWPRCNNPAVYASTFNRGAKAAAVVGVAAAVKLVMSYAEGPGGYRKAVDALGSVIAQGKEAGGALKPAAAKLAVKSAAKVAEDKAAGKKADKAAKKTVVRTRAQVTMAAAALECGKGHKEMAAFLKLASNAASKLPEREGRVELDRKARAALADVCEMFHQLAK